MAKKAAKKKALSAADVLGTPEKKTRGPAKRKRVYQPRVKKAEQASDEPLNVGAAIAKARNAKGFADGCPIPLGPAGDKSPEVVKWLFDNDRDAFKKRYHGRKVHLLPKAVDKDSDEY